MRVRVLAFARLRELLGGPERELVLADGTTAGEVWNLLAQDDARIGDLARSTRIARNGRLVSALDEPLADGDELALLPPVGGG